MLSGRATFAGYIKLDDTATYLAMTDRVMEHGRSLAGLAPSTYEATLAPRSRSATQREPMPLGVGHELLANDSAWLFQPYLAFLAAMLALTLYALLERVDPSRPAARGRRLRRRAACDPFGYALWGGVKELAARCCWR